MKQETDKGWHTNFRNVPADQYIIIPSKDMHSLAVNYALDYCFQKKLIYKWQLPIIVVQMVCSSLFLRQN